MPHTSEPTLLRAPAGADNGILGRVPSQFVAQACKSLPDPACAVDDEMQVEIDAGWAGRVRLTFRRQRYSRPRGKTTYYSWLCRHAEPVADAAQPSTATTTTDFAGSFSVSRPSAARAS